MKKIVLVLVSLVVAVLIGVGNAFAHIPDPPLGFDWKFITVDLDGTTVYVDTRRITHLPKGIVKYWELWVPRGKVRREDINISKNNLLLEGKDPNDAERLWYIISLRKVNCRTHQYAKLEDIAYSFGRSVLDDKSYQHEKWENVIPGTINEVIENYVCNKTSLSIPDPSLGPEWKPLGMDSDLSTTYFKTRKIAYLPGPIVKVWTLYVFRGEERRKIVNALKHGLLSEGKDPNKAERLWYGIELDKLNCKTHQMAELKWGTYSFRQAVLAHYSFHHEEWKNIPPGDIFKVIEKLACEKYK